MLQIFEVTKDSPWLPQVKALYESAFPANERIPMKQLLDNKIQREFFAFVDTIDGKPTFCGFSNSITRGTITNIVYFAVEPELRSRKPAWWLTSRSKKTLKTPRSWNSANAAAIFTCATALTRSL